MLQRHAAIQIGSMPELQCTRLHEKAACMYMCRNCLSSIPRTGRCASIETHSRPASKPLARTSSGHHAHVMLDNRLPAPGPVHACQADKLHGSSAAAHACACTVQVPGTAQGPDWSSTHSAYEWATSMLDQHLDGLDASLGSIGQPAPVMQVQAPGDRPHWVLE